MKRHVFALALSLTLALPAAGSATEGDLTGWRGLTFGMPMDQASAALAALPGAEKPTEREGDLVITLPTLTFASALFETSTLASNPWTVTVYEGIGANAGTIGTIWLATEYSLITDGVTMISEATGLFEDLVTALVLAYGQPDLLLDGLSDYGLRASVGRAVWRFENHASIVVIGVAHNGAFRPQIGFLPPLEF